MTRPGQRAVSGLTALARGGSRVGVSAGLLAIAIVSLVDVILAPKLVVIGLLITGPLVEATRSRPRDVAAVTGIALVAGLLLGIRDHRLGSVDHMLRLTIVLAGGLLAISPPRPRPRASSPPPARSPKPRPSCLQRWAGCSAGGSPCSGPWMATASGSPV